MVKDIHRSFKHQPGRGCVISHPIDKIPGFEMLWVATGKTFCRGDLMGFKHRKHLVLSGAEIRHEFSRGYNVIWRMPMGASIQ
jgi:hypothetical protein